MLWSKSGPNAGFSSQADAGKLAALVHPDYKTINVESIYAISPSQLRLFRELARLRQRNEVLKVGKSYISKSLNNSFAICRYMEDEGVIHGQVD